MDEKCFVEADYRPVQKNKKRREITGRNNAAHTLPARMEREGEKGVGNKNRKAPTTEIPAKPLVKDSDRNQKTEMNWCKGEENGPHKNRGLTFLMIIPLQTVIKSKN